MRYTRLLLIGLPGLVTLALAVNLLATVGGPTFAVEGGGTGSAPRLDTGSFGSQVCDPPQAHAAGTFPDETIVSGGLTREYILHVPASYDGTDALPLVFNFHGLTGTAAGQADYSGLNAKAEAAGFITVTPQGLATALLIVSHWNSALVPPETGEPDDVGFVEDLLDSLESQLCIDPARVYSTGMSFGALMSVRLGCSLSDRIAAIAPVAGVYWPPVWEPWLVPGTEVTIDEPAGCPSKTRPVPVIAFHGSADTIVPFDGGPTSLPFDIIFRLSIEEAVAEWAMSNGCDSLPQEAQAAPGVRLVSYEGCDESALVELYVVEDVDGDGPNTEGGGHTWPDATQGDTTHEISANDLMWDFFVAHPRGSGGCFGDLNGDGKVSIADVLALKPAFNSQSGDENYDQSLDLNADGRISIADVLALKPVFNQSCA